MTPPVIDASRSVIRSRSVILDDKQNSEAEKIENNLVTIDRSRFLVTVFL